ncbi:DUF397 domain-containing protein [Streptomyces cacaoi]|uniref:DUF397 domain-containing protein n=1 Tax=Streptomyces cacaoi TaxID=1898 RepID=UPI002636B117|nr:DUF397 domain-containing protein [Streptomyces cacaoi]
MEASPSYHSWRRSSYSSDQGGECVECAPHDGAAWRKSSHSAAKGGECVECAPSDGAVWRKSAHSSDQGGDCVEVSPVRGAGVAIRDSKRPGGPQLAVPAQAFAAFVASQH